MRLFRRFSLRTKLLGLCVFMAGISLTLAFTGFVGLERVSEKYRVVSEETMPSLAELNNMLLNYRNLRIHLRTLGMPGLTREEQQDAISRVHEDIRKYEEEDKRYRNFPGSSEQAALYRAVDDEWQSFKRIGERALALQAAGTPAAYESLIRLFLKDCPEAAARYTAAADALERVHVAEADRSTRAAKANANQAIYFMLFLSLSGILLGMIFGFVLSTHVSSSIDAIANTLSANSLRVSQAAGDVASSSDQLAQSATEQASSLQETAASVEQITAMIARASENANSAANSSVQSRNKAEEGQDSVQAMLSSMGEIERSNDQIMDTINVSNTKLSEIVKIIEEIGSKTKIINDIVFQTKLLSFNASVEAARAGEHGKGFAVVAEEIGNLARVSGKAAEDITSLLERSSGQVNVIVADSRSRVQAILEEGRRKINSGMDVARRCAGLLTDIVRNVTGVAELAQEIAAAGKEQAAGVSEINRAMAQLDSVTQSNATVTQNTAVAADTLSKQSEGLKDATEDLLDLVNGQSDAA